MAGNHNIVLITQNNVGRITFIILIIEDLYSGDGMTSQSLLLGQQDSITKAASIAIRSKGIDGCSMKDVAQIAKLSPGQIYRCFSSKMEIIEKLIKDCFRLQKQIFALIYEQPDPADYILSKRFTIHKAEIGIEPDLILILSVESMHYAQFKKTLLYAEQELKQECIRTAKSKNQKFSHHNDEVFVGILFMFLDTITLLFETREVNFMQEKKMKKDLASLFNPIFLSTITHIPRSP